MVHIRRLVLTMSLFLNLLLWADIEDHLKSVGDKSQTCSMRNIDCVYMINLDQRPEKWQESLVRLAPYGIVPCRVSAVNGWELTLEEIDDVGLKFSPEMQGGFMGTIYPFDHNYEPSHEIICRYGQTYFCHCMSRGAMGCVLSHLSVLQDAYDAGYQTIWVMEDDIVVMQDPRVLSDLIQRLDAVVGADQWDVLFTDRDQRDNNGCYKACYWAARRPDIHPTLAANNYALRKMVSAEFYQIGARWGTHSMILRRSGIKKLLDYFYAHQIFLPYDLEIIFPHGIKLFAVAEDVVSNLPGAPSDNGGQNYIKTSN